MNCPHCGANFSDALLNCPFCGAENVVLAKDLHTSRVETLQKKRHIAGTIPDWFVRRSNSVIFRVLLGVLTAITVVLLALGIWTVARESALVAQQKNLDVLYSSGNYSEMYDYLCRHELYGQRYTKYFQVGVLQNGKDFLAEKLDQFNDTKNRQLFSDMLSVEIYDVLMQWTYLADNYKEYTDRKGVLGNEAQLDAVYTSATALLTNTLPVTTEQLNDDVWALAEALADRLLQKE